MAVIGVPPTLIDWAKRRDPDGKVAKIGELLNQTNDVLLDMPFKESNLPTGERLTVRTGLPSATWRKLNGGVTPSKSTTAQIDESIGMLEAISVVDVDLADLNGDVNGFRESEALAFIESMNQNMASTLFYGDTSINPERFLGLEPRFNTISGAVNGQNIISLAGTGNDQTSIWLVGWGMNSVYGIFPKGSKAGLTQEDLGRGLVTVSTGVSGDTMMAYRERFQWKCGLALKDWRYVVRIANIDVPDLIAGTGSNPDLIKAMSRALDRIPFFGMCTPVFYCNRTVYSILRIQALNKSNAALGIEDALTQFGTPVKGQLSFLGIPIRRTDALLNTEPAIS